MRKLLPAIFLALLGCEDAPRTSPTSAATDASAARSPLVDTATECIGTLTQCVGDLQELNKALQECAGFERGCFKQLQECRRGARR